MATLPQAPFYVPRPADDVYWFQQPVQTSKIIRILSNQKFFGAGGQVPTRRWAPFLVDEPAVTWQPAFQNGPVRVTLTQVKFFGQPGQSPTKQWRYDWDEAAPYQIAPRGSQTIHPLLTAAGQVAARKWLYPYYNEEALWQATLENLNSGIIQQLGHQPFAKLWRYDWDDASPWAPTIENLNSGIIQQLAHTPFTKQWRYDFDDAPSWTYVPSRNTAVLQPSKAPFVTYIWQSPADDASPWSPLPLNSDILIFLSLGGKPPTPPQWSYAHDTATTWQWTPPNTIITQLVSYAIPGMFVEIIDDASTWQWVPRTNNPTSAVVNPPVQFFGPFYAPNPPVEIGWQWQSPSNLTALTTPQAPPFFATAPKYIPADEIPGWTGGLRPVPQTILGIKPTPFTPAQFRFGLDDATVWNAAPRSGFFTQKFPASFTSAMWNLNIPQDAPTTLSSFPAAALNLPAPVGATLIQRTLTGVGL